MYCNTCGNQIKDGQSFCDVCGARVETPVQQPQPQMQYQQSQMQYQSTPYKPTQYQNGYKMGWFKFIIYCQLFLNALINLYSAIRVLTGAEYKRNGYDLSDIAYEVFDGLKVVDTVYGIALIILAVCAIGVRFILAGYKKIGPICYHALVVMNIIIPFIYLILVSNFVNVTMGEVMTREIGSSTSASIFLLIYNIIYFKERKHLFVN